MTTIAGCQRLQRAWFAALARATGGRTFSTHECDWVWLPARHELMPGRQPWWMSAPVNAVTVYEPEGTAIAADVPEYTGASALELSVARTQPAKAWHAVTRSQEQIAGSAYSFYDGNDNPRALAGIFNMEVLPGYRRRGLGTALLSAVAPAGRDRGSAGTRAECHA